MKKLLWIGSIVLIVAIVFTVSYQHGSPNTVDPIDNARTHWEGAKTARQVLADR